MNSIFKTICLSLVFSTVLGCSPSSSSPGPEASQAKSGTCCHKAKTCDKCGGAKCSAEKSKGQGCGDSKCGCLKSGCTAKDCAAKDCTAKDCASKNCASKDCAAKDAAGKCGSEAKKPCCAKAKGE